MSVISELIWDSFKPPFLLMSLDPSDSEIASVGCFCIPILMVNHLTSVHSNGENLAVFVDSKIAFHKRQPCNFFGP